jgi:peptide/nickel transport system substrate-binding protein
MTTHRMHRREFLGAASAAAAASLLAACGGGSSQEVILPTKTPAPGGSAPATTGQSAASPAAVAGQASPAAVPSNIPQVPRNQTLIMSVSDSVDQMNDSEVHNPFLPTVAQRTGWHFAFEPFYFYDSVWNEKVSAPPGLTGSKGEIPYQAESYAFNPDFTELTVKLRPNITWSDGMPFTTSDVVFTINMLRDNGKNANDLNFAFDMNNAVKDIVAIDPLTVKFTLNAPNPNFMLQYFQWVQDQGFPIVPEHIFKGQPDLKSFTNHDISKGWPIVTGPWKLVFSSPTQKIWDRRDDWWGAKTGFHPLPTMKRIIILPRYEDPKLTQLLAAGEIDASHNLQPADTKTALSRNAKLAVFTTDKKPPYGAIDGWTNCIKMNCSKPPYDDPDIRWALNHAINRKQIIDVGFQGSGDFTVLPLPAYPVMKPYFDAVQDILQKYPIDSFDPKKTAEIMQGKGYAKDSDGIWTKDGKRFSFVIINSPGFFETFVPVIAQQFKQAGFDASFKFPTNAGTLEASGDAEIFVDGQSASVRDPYLSMRQYHSRYAIPNGKAALYPHRWKNADYDRIMDQMATVPGGTPQFMDLWHKAMEIWIPNLPTIPTVQWYQICPVNTAYLKGWPNSDNPYTTPASWHRGAATLFINTLQPS